MAEKLELGISQAELRKQVINAVVEKIHAQLVEEPERDITQAISAAVQEKLSVQIRKKVESAVLPLVKSKLDNLLIPQTNRYGEPKGEPLTFIEFAIQQAEKYMTEKVNYEGKAQGECYGSWNGTQTRITHMVHHYLHFSIETAMKKALADANSKIVKGIEETVKIKLAEISSQLQMTVKTR